MKKYMAKIEQESILTLPDEVVEDLGLHVGDEAHFKDLENGSFQITFSKKEDVQIDIDEKLLYQLMLLAHEQDITLNQLVENILREFLNKLEKKVSVEELEDGDIFDRVIDDVEKGATYIIYEDKEYTKPSAVLVPINKYEEMHHVLQA